MRSSGSRYGTPTRWIFRKAPSSPTPSLPVAFAHVRGAEDVDGLALELVGARRGAVGRRSLGGGALGAHPLVVGREDLHEALQQVVPLLEHAPGDRRAGALGVLGDERAALDRVTLVERLELVAHRRVDARRERPVLVEDECQAAAHAGGEVAPRRPEDDDAPAGHVLAAVVADALDDGARPGVAHGEALTGEAAREELAARCAVEDGVADDDVLLGAVRGTVGRQDRERSARQALAGVVVGVAMEAEAHARGQPAAERLARRAAELDVD